MAALATARLRMMDLVRAGARGVSRYTGTLFAVFLVQSIVAAGCMLAVAAVLANAFATLPMFDDGVDGDLAAILTCVRGSPTSFIAVIGIVLGAILMWQLASWFLAGGINGVLDQRPEGRREVARVFGASGASTYLRYARLAVCSLPGVVVVLFVLLLCVQLVGDRLEQALTAGDLALALAGGLLPAAILAFVLATATDYARVELTLRGDTHAPGVVMTYLRALVFVVRRPLTLAFAALTALAWIAITCGYMVLAHGHAMYGAEGAITLFVIRQGVSLARMAVRFGEMAGEVELGRTRPLPPRRIDAVAAPGA